MVVSVSVSTAECSILDLDQIRTDTIFSLEECKDDGKLKR
jgi:hypothetical protein